MLGLYVSKVRLFPKKRLHVPVINNNNNNTTIIYQDKPFSKTAGINGCPGSVNYN